MRAALLALLLSTVSAFAGDLALVIGNERYVYGEDAKGALATNNAAIALRQAGFEVIGGGNLNAGQMRSVVDQFEKKADGSGRIAIVLVGRFQHFNGSGYFLSTDISVFGLGSIGTAAVSLEHLAVVAQRSQGGSVMVLGYDRNRAEHSLDTGAGPGVLVAPQGVTVIEGGIVGMAKFAEVTLRKRGVSVQQMLEGWPNAQARGFLSSLVPYRATQDDPVFPAVDPNQDEKALWRITRNIDTKEAYENYLNRHPRGLFEQDARVELSRIANQPLEAAKSGEAALQLSRNERRQIQRNLTLLEFDTRGIDGIFGRGSRTAIADWQKFNGIAATGFLNGTQVSQIKAQADRRAAKLEVDAARRQAELDRQDRAFWRSTGQLGDEAGLRAYLERYPEGEFSDLARERLSPFEQADREAAAAQDRAAWDAADAQNSEAAYLGYIQSFPQGAFAKQAETRLNELVFARRNAAALQAAARNEERLGLNQGTRRLVEDRLTKLGLKPGPVDGVFDNTTRRAIRRYQDARKLQKTGYLNQSTLVRLLADSVLR